MRRALIGIIVVLLLAASGIMAAQAGKQATVLIKDLRYNPASVTVHPGETVVWINQDDMDHTVVGDDKTFASPTLKSGDTYSRAFPKKGVFSYSCRLHPRMKGVVRVE